MKRILSYLKPFKMRISLGLSIKMIGTIAELLLPFILSHILENVISTLNVGKIVSFGIIMVFCAGVACVANITANRMAAKVTMKFSMEMRKDLFLKTLYLSAADTDLRR